MLDREIPRSSAWWRMEISLFVLSMSEILSLWGKTRFFFKPVQVNLLLTDLAVQLRNKFVFIPLFAFTLVAEQVYQPFLGSSLPVPDLPRMYLMLTCQLGRCLLLFDRI